MISAIATAPVPAAALCMVCSLLFLSMIPTMVVGQNDNSCVVVVTTEEDSSIASLTGVHGFTSYLAEVMFDGLCMNDDDDDDDDDDRRQLQSDNCDILCVCCPWLCAALGCPTQRRHLTASNNTKTETYQEHQDLKQGDNQPLMVSNDKSFLRTNTKGGGQMQERSLTTGGPEILVEKCSFTELKDWPKKETQIKLKEVIDDYNEEYNGEAWSKEDRKALKTAPWVFLENKNFNLNECAKAMA